MLISLEIQEKIRLEMLSNLDIEKVDHLITDRKKLISALVDIFDEYFNNNQYHLNTQAQYFMIDMIVDEIMGFGPLTQLMEDDSVSDILVNGPENIFIERKGILEKANCRFINNQQSTINGHC